MRKNKYFKDWKWYAATAFIVFISVAFAIGVSPWWLLIIPAYAALLYLMRNNP